MKELSIDLSAALGAPVQRPALLVEIGYSPVVRLTTYTDITWDSRSWVVGPMRIDGLQVGPFNVAGTLVLGNADGAAGSMLLAQGIKDRAIRVYGYDAAAVGEPDVVWLADAAGSGAQIGTRDVRIQLGHRSEGSYAPRARVGAATGITQLLAAGTVLRINGIDLTLERSQ